MCSFPVPRNLAETAGREPGLTRWLASLPEVVADVADRWSLRVGEPFEPGGQCSWTAPAARAGRENLVLKVAYRFAGEEERDPGYPFRPLAQMCAVWADEFEAAYGGLADVADRLDPGLARAGIALFRELPASAGNQVLLCTDLHGENILASRREPWLVIDPKPYVGDPAYDVLQHMLNCEDRMAADPAALADRMAGLAGLDAGRVRLWLFARAVQESIDSPLLREVASRVAPA